MRGQGPLPRAALQRAARRARMGRSARGPQDLVDTKALHIEVEGGPTRNGVAGPLSAVADSRRDDEGTLLAWADANEALIPALDDLACGCIVAP